MIEEKALVLRNVHTPSIIDGDNFDKLVRAVKLMFDDTRGQITTKQALRLAATAHEEPGMGIMEAINGGLHMIEGKPELSARSLAKKIRMFGHNYKLLELTREKCKIKGTRGDNGDELTVEYTIDDAKIAGLLKPNSGWQKHPKNMLFAFCIRNLASWHFPEVRGSAYLPGEVEDSIEMPGTPIDVTPKLEDEPEQEPEQIEVVESEVIDGDEALANELENIAEENKPIAEEIVEKDLTTELIEQFKLLRAKSFIEFYEENKDDITEWPTEAQTVFIEKWEKLAKKNKKMGICPLLNTDEKSEEEIPAQFDGKTSKGEKVNKFYNVLATAMNNDDSIKLTKEKVHSSVKQIAEKRGVDPDDFIAERVDKDESLEFFIWLNKIVNKKGEK